MAMTPPCVESWPFNWTDHFALKLSPEKRAADSAKYLRKLEENVRRGFLQALEKQDLPKDLELEIRERFKVPVEYTMRRLKRYQMKQLRRDEFIQKMVMLELEGKREVRLQIREEAEELKMPPFSMKKGEQFKVPTVKGEQFKMPDMNKSLVPIGIMLLTAAVLLISGFLIPGMSLSKSFHVVCWQTALGCFFAASLAIRDHIQDFGSARLPLHKVPY